MATIGSLGINFETNAAQILNDFQKITRDVNRMEGAIGKSLSAITSVAKMAAGALGAMFSGRAIKNAFDYASELNDIAQRTGFATDFIQEMQVAGQKNATSVQTMNGALDKFNKTIGDAANGSKEQAELFKRLGISIEDGNGGIKTSQQLIYELADALSRYESPAVRASIAAKFFGKDAGSSMAVLLSQGSAALRAYLAQAKEVAGVLDGELAAAAASASDDLSILGTAVERNFNAGILTELRSHFDDIAGSTKTWATTARDMGQILGYVAGGAMDVARTIGEILSPLGAVIGGMEGFKAICKTVVDAVKLDFLALKVAVLGAADVIITYLVKIDDAFAVLYEKMNIDYQKSTWLANLKTSIEAEGNATIAQMEKTSDSLLKNSDDFMTAIKKRADQLNGLVKPTGDGGLAKLAPTVNDAANSIKGGLTPAAKEADDVLAKLGKKTVSSLVDDLGDLVFGTKKGSEAFHSFAMSVIKDLGNMLLQATISPVLNSIGSSIFGFKAPAGTPTLSQMGTNLGNFFGGMFGGARAGGGDVAAGKAYIVGEKRPEVFVPGRSGTILPQVPQASGGTYYIDARGADQSGLARLENMIRALNGSVEKRALAAFYGESVRNPGFIG